jgi:branched-chain amino acid transport system permease protein
MSILLQQFINLLQLGSVYALIAIGFSIVYGILGFVNFAHGDIFMVSTYISFFVATWLFKVNSTAIIVLLITMIISSVLTSVLATSIERVAYKPLRYAPKVSVVVTSLAIGMLLQHLVLAGIGPDAQRMPQFIPDIRFQVFSVNIELYQIVIILFAVFMMLLLNFFIQKTRTGIAMRAVAQDGTAAGLMGISNNYIISMAFIVGASAASVGGCLYSLAYPIFDPYIGSMINWWSFVAAVIGGIGNLRGAVLGGYLLAGVMVFTPMILPASSYRDLVAFGLLVVVLLVKPSGLLGKTTIQKV